MTGKHLKTLAFQAASLRLSAHSFFASAKAPFTLIELPVLTAQYCRNHVKVLYNRIGMQGAGGGALAGNTMNTDFQSSQSSQLFLFRSFNLAENICSLKPP